MMLIQLNVEQIVSEMNSYPIFKFGCANVDFTGSSSDDAWTEEEDGEEERL